MGMTQSNSCLIDRRLARRLSPLLVLSLAACYTYVPVQPTSVAAGAGVRARVSATTAERIAPLIGVTDARVFMGTFVGTDAGGFLVEVPTTPQVGTAGTFQTLAQRISIPRADLLEIETRTLNRGKTAAIVGAVAIIAGSTAATILRSNPGADRPPGGTSTDTRIPVLRWRF
jgi:predicted acyltransferase